MEIKARVRDIFRDVFDDPKLEITNSTCVKDIEDWDSLANISLIVAMEKEFSMRFNIADIQKLQNVGDMIALIERSAK